MTTLADVLVYLELHADDSTLVRLQEVEIPRIRRQRNANGHARRPDVQVAEAPGWALTKS
jgi:hypothetical protein